MVSKYLKTLLRTGGSTTSVLAGCLIGTTLFFMVPHSASAQVLGGSSFVSQLEQFYEKYVILERWLTTIQKQVDTNLINEYSLVKTTEEAVLHSEAGNAALLTGSVGRGVMGTVSAGPRFKDGLIWWQIDFQNGSVGWAPENVLSRIPSTVLNIDADLDGVPESTLRFVGEFDPGGFAITHSGNDTILRYFGEDVDSAVYENYTRIPAECEKLGVCR